MTHRTPIVVLATLLLVGTVAHAQSRWTITTADFNTLTVTAVSLDEAGARVAPESGGEARTIPWDQFLLAERADPAPDPVAAAAPFVLTLVTGDRLTGKPAGVADEAVRWQTNSAGNVSVPLRQVRAMVRAGPSAASAAAPGDDPAARMEDVVTLANGDAVRGIVTDLSADAVTIMPMGGDAVPVPLDSVVAVHFANPAGGSGVDAAAPGTRTFRVRLTDGSALTGTNVRLAEKELTLTLSGGESRTIAAETVAGIEQLNGPVAWLSSLPPSENVHIPFLDTAWPARMDRTVTGDPIRVGGGRTVSRGIGVHSRSRITWPLDGTYAAFRTQYAIDGDHPYANVTVRVKLDEKVVHEQTDVTAGPPSQVVQVPLGDAKSLTLEVDYGQAYDVQDRFVWIEPALLRNVPAGEKD